jgi:hypothetical protein
VIKHRLRRHIWRYLQQPRRSDEKSDTDDTDDTDNNSSMGRGAATAVAADGTRVRDLALTPPVQAAQHRRQQAGGDGDARAEAEPDARQREPRRDTQRVAQRQRDEDVGDDVGARFNKEVVVLSGYILFSCTRGPPFTHAPSFLKARRHL